MKISAVVWKSASSLKCVNQFTPSNLKKVFYSVIEVGWSVASPPWQEGAGISWAGVCWCSSGDFEHQNIPWDEGDLW